MNFKLNKIKEYYSLSKFGYCQALIKFFSFITPTFILILWLSAGKQRAESTNTKSIPLIFLSIGTPIAAIISKHIKSSLMCSCNIQFSTRLSLFRNFFKWGVWLPINFFPKKSFVFCISCNYRVV